MFRIEGKRKAVGETAVIVNTSVLPLHLGLVNHSPSGFEWGYGGSGPSQLAFCILYEYYIMEKKMHFEDALPLAKQYYQQFKWAFISGIKEDRFVITGDQIERFLYETQNPI